MNQHSIFGPAPPQTSFSSIKAALEHCQDHARDLGYCVVIRSTEKDDIGMPFRSYFACDRGEVYRNRTKSIAKPRKLRTEGGVLAGTGSRKTNCPFQLRLEINKEGVWQLIVNQLTHNHPPSLNSSAHPALRRRDVTKHQDEIKRSYNAGESTRTIISALRAKGAKCLPRNIYNYGQKIRLESLGGLTPIQWLKEELDRLGYYNKINYDKATNKVTRLFYIYPTSIKLWKSNPDYLLLDYTYKTNRFNMPLLNICGVTGNNKTPQFALCFLSGEKEEDYKWALEQLRGYIALYSIQEPTYLITNRELALITIIDELFPQSDHFLCRWHVNMNVLKNYKKHFNTKEEWEAFYTAWHGVLNSRNTEEYKKNLLKLLNFPWEPVQYLEDTWLIWKEKLIKQYTNQVRHFGNTSTSRIEGNHAILKSYLRKSTGDMKSVFDRFQLYWRNQYETMEDDLANESIRPLYSIQIPLFATVIGFVHAFALHKIVTQKSRIGIEPPPLPCECGTPRYMGIPYWHILWERIQGGGIVILSDINPHWYYNRGDGIKPLVGRQVIPLLNPDVVKGKGRPKGALGKKNTAILVVVDKPVLAPPARGRGRGRGSRRRGGQSHKRGYGKTSTRRHPSAFEIDPYEFPSSTAPARLQKRPAPEDNDENETQEFIDVDCNILPEAQELLDVSLAEIASGKPPLTLSTTQVALARGAGTRRDSYVPGTVRERAYMRSKSTIAEKDMEDTTLDELASNDVIQNVDINLVPPPTSAPARPQRSTRKQVDWSHLLSDKDDDDDDDSLVDDPEFSFEWDV